jgi:hypothetical protein
MPDARQTDGPVPSPIRIVEPARAHARADLDIDAGTREAARRVLARDGRDFVLQPWQAAWLIATSEGREGFVPPGCGVGAGWLAARLEEEAESR